MTESERRISRALEYAYCFGSVDGEHHKKWVMDQMVRALTGCPIVQKSKVDYREEEYTYAAQGESDEYLEWVRKTKDGEDGPETYEWDEGIAP